MKRIRDETYTMERWSGTMTMVMVMEKKVYNFQISLEVSEWETDESSSSNYGDLNVRTSKVGSRRR